MKWWTSYKAYAVVWFALGLLSVWYEQPLGAMGCTMTGVMALKLSKWQRMP